ncbi:Sodium-independent sulfate anion transporter, partial [Orchesella cincta]
MEHSHVVRGNEEQQLPTTSGGDVLRRRRGFSVKNYVKKRLPILKWLPAYRPRTDWLPDTISGISVGLTAVPQSIAYADVAGLTPEYGLYSSFVSCFVYIFLGSCRQMTIGPTALMELLVFETCGEAFPQCVILVGFYSGCFQLLMGLLKLGAVVSLISDPVTIGFVGGASLTICSSQIRSFLGLTGAKGDGFLDSIIKAFENIKSAKLGDSLLGLGCVIFLLVCKNLKDYVPKEVPPLVGKLLWFLSLSRNALVVIIATGIAASLSDPPFALTGKVKSGFPPVGPPQFTLPGGNNSTSGGTLTFWETWQELGTAPLTIAVISILQNVAIAKAFGSGQSIDATQEMIALGASHIIASFFSSLPTAGSFTRSAVNEASGVRSPFGGIATAALVLFALSFLTEWFQYIPKASLAAVILCAVLPMIEYESLWPMWKVSKLDVLTAIITFLGSLWLGMEYGLVIGVGVSLALYLVRPVRPRMEWRIVKGRSSSVDRLLSQQAPVLASSQKQYHLIKPEQGFCFPSVDAIRTKINKVALSHPEVEVIVLDCQNMIGLDYTSASALACLVKALKQTGKSLVFVHTTHLPSWKGIMSTVGLKEPECYDNFEELESKQFLD